MNNYYYLIFLLSTMSLFSMDQQNNKNISQTKVQLRDYSDDLSEYFKAVEADDKAKEIAVLQKMHKNYTQDYSEFKIQKKHNDDAAPGYDELY